MEGIVLDRDEQLVLQHPDFAAGVWLGESKMTDGGTVQHLCLDGIECEVYFPYYATEYFHQRVVGLEAEDKIVFHFTKGHRPTIERQ